MSVLELLNNQEENDPGSQVPGVVVGIVTDNKDPEKLGRVKINFPWRGEEGQSFWARICTFMAGKERGSFFLPEVHDEVLVAFDRGDIDRPFVIGALWNGKDKPPETNEDGKNNIRKITSRSGHEIIFNDDNEGKKEMIEIHTKGGQKIIMDDTQGKEKIETQSKSGHKIVLNDASGQEKIEIIDKTGSNKIVIDSMQKAINIESGMQLKIKANMMEIEGSSSLTIKSSGILTLQGSLVKIN